MTTGYEEELKSLGGFENVIKKWASECKKYATQKHSKDYNREELKKARKLDRLSDEEIVKIVKGEQKKDLRYNIKGVEEVGKNIELLEETLDKIDFVLSKAEHPKISEGLKDFKEFYEGRLKEYIKKDIPYHAEQLISLTKITKENKELLKEKREEINRSINYHIKELRTEQTNRREYGKLSREYTRLYNFLKRRKSK